MPSPSLVSSLESIVRIPVKSDALAAGVLYTIPVDGDRVAVPVGNALNAGMLVDDVLRAILGRKLERGWIVRCKIVVQQIDKSWICVVAHHRVDEIMISTFAGEQSKWLQSDLIGRVREITDKPVSLLELGVEGRDAAGKMEQVFTEVSARATRALVIEARESRFAAGTLSVNIEGKAAY